MLNSGPPELPGFTAASVWMKVTNEVPLSSGNGRPTALTTPAVTLFSKSNGEPMAIETTPLSGQRFPGLRRLLAKSTSLYAVLSQTYGISLLEAEETIETVPAPPREAHLLGTDVGLPLLLLSRHSLDDAGKPIEYVRSMYRGDRYMFVAHLQRPTD